MKQSFIVAGLLLLICFPVSAVMRFVDLNNPNPAAPYTSWATAATTIQDAIDAAVAGDEIVVTNGVYATGGRAMHGTMTNRIVVDKPVSVRSVNGPGFTIIEGRQLPGVTNGDGAIRCAYLTNDATLTGFTLTNGATRALLDFLPSTQTGGGGIWCESPSAVISNCVIAGNSAYRVGGGVYRGTLSSCILSNNNVQDVFNGIGGGTHSSTLYDCTLVRNSAPNSGGGAFGGTLNTLSNCFLINNSAGENGGGAYGVTLNNCVLLGNTAYFGGGAANGNLNSCTVISNAANEGGGVFQGTFNNSILYFNTASQGANYILTYSQFDYCCTTPKPPGNGNITNEPVFVDLGSGNLRLQPGSPCIDAGNNDYVTSGMDLDGAVRIRGSAVDMGAYEYQGSQPVLKVAKSAGSAVLSWPQWASDFLIQQIGATPMTSAGWSNLVANPIIINNENSVSVPLEGTQRLFRLFKP